MNEVVSCQSSVVSGQSEDPLADACCPHCDYSLRGLPENRCPECGNPFDPAEVVGKFRPKWPAMMKWFLFAYVLSGCLTSPFLISSLVRLRSMPSSYAFAVVSGFPGLARDLVFVILGAIAAFGLHRRRDWGRKVGVAVFAAACLSWVLPVPLAIAFYSPTPFIRSTDLLLFGLSQWTAALSPCLMIIFLTTGLRRRSLARQSNESPPLLSRAQISPRKDWPFLAVIIFINLAVLETWQIVQCFMLFRYLRMQGYPAGKTACLAAMFITAAAALWLWRSVILQWRRPQAVRTLVIVNLVALGVALATRQTADYLIWPSPSPSPILIAHAVRNLLASLLPSFSLLVFAFRDLTNDDVQLVKRPRQ